MAGTRVALNAISNSTHGDHLFVIIMLLLPADHIRLVKSGQQHK